MRLLFVTFALLCLVATSQAAVLNTWDTTISINKDGTTEWVVIQEYNDTVSSTGYFAFVDAQQIRVLADGTPIACTVSKELGTSVLCTKQEFKRIEYHFKTVPVIQKFNNINIFKNRFSVTQLTDEFTVTVQLPLFTAIAEKSKLAGTGIMPFEPAFGRETTDGRRISVEWALSNPILGTTMDTAVAFEEIPESQDIVLFGTLAGFIVIAALGGFFYLRRTRIKNIMPIMTEHERKVIEIVMRDKKVDQRKVVKETDFSKAKVSRIVQNLLSRGVLEKVRKGRTNILTLKTAEMGTIAPKKQQEENKDKNQKQ